MEKDLSPLLLTVVCYAPASDAALRAVQIFARGKIPNDYIGFLMTANGGEGPIGQSGYIRFWKAEEIEPFNKSYNVEEFAPDVLLFGSNGGIDAYGFDLQKRPVEYISLPFIGMNRDEIEPLGRTLTEFLQNMSDLSDRDYKSLETNSTYKYQLVVQTSAESEDDFETMLALEEKIAGLLGGMGKVDGHDCGAGEMNLFIQTDSPERVYEHLKFLLHGSGRFDDMKVAYREISGERYKVIHPLGLQVFKVL